MSATIETIQFKRGKKATLEAKLVEGVLGVLKQGEPAFETDTNKLKVGDGKSNYKDLPYLTGDTANFVIHDVAHNQILIYDATLEQWVNKDLADKDSIIYLDTKGLSIKGYDEAKQGQILVKDSENGIAWIDPVDLESMQELVAAAETASTNANNYALDAGNSASKASQAASTAERINAQTMNFVNSKFWWGTLEEYNNLEQITEGTFYFVKI